MLELHKIMGVSHVVACPPVFILFCDRGWQGEVFKVMKSDNFSVFLAVWDLFPKFFNRLRGGLY